MDYIEKTKKKLKIIGLKIMLLKSEAMRGPQVIYWKSLRHLSTEQRLYCLTITYLFLEI